MKLKILLAALLIISIGYANEEKVTETTDVIRVVEVNATDGVKYKRTFINIHLKNSNKCVININ